MRWPRFSIARLMVGVALVACDCAMLGTGHIDPALLVTIPVLQVGLFRVLPRRGAVRPFWAGFEGFGWAAVVLYYAVLRRPMFLAFDRGLFGVARLLAPRWPGLVRWLDWLLVGDGLLFGVWAWGAVLGFPLLVAAYLGGLLARRRACRKERERSLAASGPGAALAGN